LVAHVINLVTFKLFYTQIRQNLKLFEAEFWEFSEPSFGATSRGLLRAGRRATARGRGRGDFFSISTCFLFALVSVRSACVLRVDVNAPIQVLGLC
jgi:hypothetical protein